MKESHGEGLATHTGPESCAVGREVEGEALTGVRAGQVWSRETERTHRGVDAVRECGRPHSVRRYRETERDPARSKTQCMHGNISDRNREIPCPPVGERTAGRVGKFKDARR